MASAISYEFYSSEKGSVNGIATLDSSGKLTESQLPAAAIDTYKGIYTDEAALIAAYPAASTGDYARNEATSSYWYWNSDLDTPAWVNQEITAVAYDALSEAARAAVPYIITV